MFPMAGPAARAGPAQAGDTYGRPAGGMAESDTRSSSDGCNHIPG